MAKFAFGYFDGTNLVISPDITITSTPTRYSYTFTTPNVIGGDAYIGVFDSSGDPDQTLDVEQIMLNEGTQRAYTIDTPTSVPLGGGAAAIVSFSSTNSLTGSFVRHYTGILIPDSKKLANQHSNAQLFEQFVPFPVDDPSYIAPVLDAGFTSSFTATINVETGNGRNSSIAPSITTSLDAWNDGAVDPNTFEDWGSATATGRYFVARVVMQTTGVSKTTGAIPAVGYISALSLKLTSPSKQKIINAFAVDAAGTTLNFPGVFHSAPNIQITPTSAGATSGGASNLTASSAFIQLFNGANEVSGECSVVLNGG